MVSWVDARLVSRKRKDVDPITIVFYGYTAFYRQSRNIVQIFTGWGGKDGYFASADDAPGLLFHGDADQRNAFLRLEGVVLIDWSFAGLAAVGEEIEVHRPLGRVEADQLAVSKLLALIL